MVHINKKAIAEVSQKHSLDFVVLYGSAAKKTITGPETDIDIAIYRQGGISPDEYKSIYYDLQKQIPGELDLKTLHQVDPFFRYQAAYLGTLLYGDQTEYNEYKAYVYKDMVDSQSLLKLEAQLVKKFQQELDEKHDR